MKIDFEMIKGVRKWRIDQWISYLGVLFSVPATILIVLKTNNITYLTPGIILFVVCLYWIIINKRGGKEKIDKGIETARPRTFLLLISSFFILLTISMWVYYLRPDEYSRPTFFFILIASMWFVIFLQIFFVPRKYSFLILIQTTIIFYMIIASQFALFPDSVVGIDPIYHEYTVQQIISNGNIPSGGLYSDLPLFHLMLAAFLLLTNLVSYSLASIMIISMVQFIVISILIFKISQVYLKDFKIGLLAVLFLSGSSFEILYGFLSIPNTMASTILFVMIYLLLFKKQNGMLSIVTVILIAAFSLIITHTMTSVAFVLLLVILYIFDQKYLFTNYSKNYSKISLGFLILFIVAMISWWSYASKIAFDEMVSLLAWGLTTNPLVGETGSTTTAVVITESLVNYLPVFVFLSLSVLGLLKLLSTKERSWTFMAILGIVPLGIGAVTFVALPFLVPERWWYLAEIFLAIPLAMSVIMLVTKRKHKVKTLLLTGSVLCILVLFSTLSIFANYDNPVATPNTSFRYALTTSEIVSHQAMDKYYNSVYTDRYYIWWFGPHGIDSKDIGHSIITKNFTGIPNNVPIVIRSNIIDRTVLIDSVPYKMKYDLYQTLYDQGYQKTYDSGSVRTFIA
jgi:hypothetical protein